MSPNAKFTMPAITAEVGRTSFGKLICLISRSIDVTELTPSPTTEVNHFQGRMAANTNSG